MRVTAAGELDLANSAALQAQLSELRDAGFQHIVLDLRELTFMDSAGVRLICRVRSALLEQPLEGRGVRGSLGDVIARRLIEEVRGRVGRGCRRGETLTTLATQSELDALQARVEALEEANTTLTQTVDALQDKLSKVSYDATGVNGRPTLTIAGANLQIVNGLSTTESMNGLGNLFVGYDEFGGTQTGSHNVILGTHQTFTSYGGIAGGGSNTLSGPGSVVFGGGNTASGSRSAVTGGSSNVASGAVSWIGGAQNSDATAQNASISGGANNTASRAFASISGGSNNVASGFSSSVSGGGLNEASGDNSSILGGRDVTVSTPYGTSP